MCNKKNLFPTGFKGIFSIKTIKETILKDVLFYIAILISAIISVVIFFMPDRQVIYIEMVSSLIVSVMPALLGLSIAGFAIVSNQTNEEFLIKMAAISEENQDYSFYQKQNAIFSITVLLQLIPLILTVFIKFVIPITIKIPVSLTIASVGNITTLFVTILFFVYALLSILGLIKSIFNTGQVINALIYNKLRKTSREQITSSTTS